MKRILLYLIAAFTILALPSSAQTCVTQSQVTLTGNLRAANGLPASNTTINLTPTQTGFIAGCGVTVPVANACATSTDGSVVGLPNPLTATIVSTAGTGTLAPGVYYTTYAWYDAAGHVSLAAPETVTTLSGTGSLVVNAPASGVPAIAVGMYVYISTSSGTETRQGTTTGTSAYTQSSALTTGAALPASNNSLCQATANDAIWPVGTGYRVTQTDKNGNAIPGYPMLWQLLGAGTTINLSNGLPYYNGLVTYPVPILSIPLNHGAQSISGPLSLSGYSLTNAGWVDSVHGYLVNSTTPALGRCLASDGSYFNTAGTCITLGGTLNNANCVVGAGAGTSGSCILVGTDANHQVSVSTGTSPTASAIVATVTFTTSRGHLTYCTISPQANGAAYSAIDQIVRVTSGSATSYVLFGGVTPLATPAVYLFNVVCP